MLLKKGAKTLQSINHKSFLQSRRLHARRSLRQENSLLTSKEIELFDFESTATLDHERFCLIKPCL